METKIIEAPVNRSVVEQMAREHFADIVKAVVDIQREVIALGGDLHADQEYILIEHGSRQENLWGINLHPAKQGDAWLEFDSMINLRPSQGNRSRGVDDPATQQRIRELVANYFRSEE